MPKKVKINRKLRAARNVNFWTLKDAADAVGVCPQTYFRWEHGEQVPQPGSMFLLCKAFGVTNPKDLGF